MLKAPRRTAPAKRKGFKPGARAVIRIVGAQGPVRKVRFGAVTVTLGALDRTVENRNILQGQKALKRASTSLRKPGVALPRKKGVPRFHSDPKSPGRVVRVMNGKTSSGVFDSSGVFRPS